MWCESINALITNCTLTGNSTVGYGGGAYGGTLDHCTLTDNLAYYGGGASYSMVNHCRLTGNSASYGGGTSFGTLNHCTLAGNSGFFGGGTYDSVLKHCIVFFNAASYDANYHDDIGGARRYSCSTPLPPGPGNIDADPRFLDTNGWANLRLQSNSPCINAGNNAYVTSLTDFDGNPRIVGGTVDAGAYEFQSPASRVSYAWLQAYGLAIDGSADFADPDQDGMNDWQEWQAGTNPTNTTSLLRMLVPTNSASDQVVRWTSVTNRTYFLQRATNLAGPSPFSVLQANLPGQADTTMFTDTNRPPGTPLFYRVGVQP